MANRLIRSCCAALALLAAPCAAPDSAAAATPTPIPTVVLPLDMQVEMQMGDIGLVPEPTKAEQARIGLATGELRRLMSETGRYEVLDISAREADIRKAAPFNKCNGCEVEIAKAAGAKLAVTGVVQKASELLLNVSLFVRDVTTGEVIKSMAVSIRQNNDESWLRAIRSLVKNRLATEEETK
ncbi:MAG: DUF3280 domain-containing protein [Hyphomicrobiaceae bacterium]|nr:DUF3280 domain-containing protein [Hyphomicrobiaceae bacterium]